MSTTTHMLLYLMMEATITAIHPSSVRVKAMVTKAFVRAVSASEYCLHSSHMGKQVKFSK